MKKDYIKNSLLMTVVFSCIIFSLNIMHVSAFSLAEQISQEINKDVNEQAVEESNEPEQLEEELPEENNEPEQKEEVAEENSEPEPIVEVAEENSEPEQNEEIVEENNEPEQKEEVVEENNEPEQIEKIVEESNEPDQSGNNIELIILADIQPSQGKVLGAFTGKNKAAAKINEVMWILFGSISLIIFYAYLRRKEVFYVFLLISINILTSTGFVQASRVTPNDFSDTSEIFYNGDIVRFKVIYQNISKNVVEDLQIQVQIPEGTTYIKESIEVTPAEHDYRDHSLPTFSQTDAKDSDISYYSSSENFIEMTQTQVPSHSANHGGTMSFEVVIDDFNQNAKTLTVEAEAFTKNTSETKEIITIELEKKDDNTEIVEVESTKESVNNNVQILTENTENFEEVEEKSLEERIAEDEAQRKLEDQQEAKEKQEAYEAKLQEEAIRKNAALDRKAEKKLAALNRRLAESQNGSEEVEEQNSSSANDSKNIQVAQIANVLPYTFEKEIVEAPHKFPSKVYMGCLGYNDSRNIQYTDNTSVNAALVENMSKFYINLPSGKKYYPLSGYGAASDAIETSETVGSDDPVLKGHLAKILVMLRCSDFPETIPPSDVIVEFTDAPIDQDIAKFIYGAQRLKIVLGEGITEENLEMIDTERKVKAQSGLFKPVNKAEAISMIFRTIQLVPKDYRVNETVLSEELRGKWFSRYFAYAVENGIAKSSELKRPGSSIPRHLVFKITILSIENKMQDPRWQFDWKETFINDLH